MVISLPSRDNICEIGAILRPQEEFINVTEAASARKHGTASLPYSGHAPKSRL
jgi:hypothetical protein